MLIWFVWLNVSSFEVGFFWEATACSLDDDVGSVVCSLHTLIQRFLLDQLRQETCTTCAQVRMQKTYVQTTSFKMETLTSYESITGTICVNYVLRANFQNWKCFNLVTYTKINAGKKEQKSKILVLTTQNRKKT